MPVLDGPLAIVETTVENSLTIIPEVHLFEKLVGSPGGQTNNQPHPSNTFTGSPLPSPTTSVGATSSSRTTINTHIQRLTTSSKSITPTLSRNKASEPVSNGASPSSVASGNGSLSSPFPTSPSTGNTSLTSVNSSTTTNTSMNSSTTVQATQSSATSISPSTSSPSLLSSLSSPTKSGPSVQPFEGGVTSTFIPGLSPPDAVGIHTHHRELLGPVIGSVLGGLGLIVILLVYMIRRRRRRLSATDDFTEKSLSPSAYAQAGFDRLAATPHTDGEQSIDSGVARTPLQVAFHHDGPEYFPSQNTSLYSEGDETSEGSVSLPSQDSIAYGIVHDGDSDIFTFGPGGELLQRRSLRNSKDASPGSYGVGKPMGGEEPDIGDILSKFRETKKRRGGS